MGQGTSLRQDREDQEAEEEVIVLWFVIFAVFFYLVSVMVDRWGPM
jgi:hypothetical protein